MSSFIFAIHPPFARACALCLPRPPAGTLAVIGGALLAELILFFALRHRRRSRPSRPFRRRGYLLWGGALLCCAVLAGSWMWADQTYKAALSQLNAGDYAASYAQLMHLPGGYRDTARCRVLCEAGQALTDGRFVEAADLLDAIPGFRNADALARQYEPALIDGLIAADRLEDAREKCLLSCEDRTAQLQEIALYFAVRKMWAHDYAAAIADLQQLTLEGFSPAGDTMRQCAYLYMKEYYEDGDYVSAIPLARLARDTRDAPALLDTMLSCLYPQAVACYRAGDYEQARAYFRVLRSYRNSDDYQTLLDAHQAVEAGWWELLPTLCKDLLTLGDWEDARALVAQPPLLGAALEGGWQAGDTLFVFRQVDADHMELEQTYHERSGTQVIALAPGAAYDAAGNLLFTIDFPSARQVAFACAAQGEQLFIRTGK